MRFWGDIETRSSISLKQGIAKYSTAVEVLIFSWAVDEGLITTEDLTVGEPSQTLISAANKADELWFHGTEFDRTVLETTDWWPKINWNKYRCTMALSRMHGLMGKLEQLCEIFKIKDNEAKDKHGREWINLFCKPKKDGTFNDRHSHPTQWSEFLKYAGQDVVAMRAVWKLCPKWNATPRMWSMWHLDQRMNARGVAVDLELAQGAIDATTIAKKRMGDRTAELTDNAVERTTQRDKLLAYMADYGVNLPDLTADTVERRLEDERLPEHIKELLRVRQQASKSSTSKYKRVLDAQVNGRLYNLLVFCGAARTGRWAGRTFQPQNLYRGTVHGEELRIAIDALRSGDIDLYYE